MNTYEKVGTFIARIGGTLIAAIGALGPIYAGLSIVFGYGVPEYPADRWAGSVTWTVLGVALFLMAKPFGRLMGRGLE